MNLKAKQICIAFLLIATVFSCVTNAQDQSVDDGTIKNFMKEHLPMLQRDFENSEGEDQKSIISEARGYYDNFMELKSSCGNDIAALSIRLVNMDHKCIDLASDYYDAKYESEMGRQKDLENRIRSLVDEMYTGLFKVEQAKLAAIEKKKDTIKAERLKWYLEYFED